MEEGGTSYKKKQRDRLNELGKQWKPKTGEENVWKASREEVYLWNEIIRLVLEIYDPIHSPETVKYDKEKTEDYRVSENRHDTVQDFIKYELKKYDPDKSLLTSYIDRTLKLREIDHIRKEEGRIYKDPNENDPQKRQASERKTRVIVSLYGPFENKDGKEQKGEETVGKEDIGFSLLEEEGELEKAFELIASILRLEELKSEGDIRKTARSANKLRYYKLFYTNGIINIEKDGYNPPQFRHVRDVVKQMRSSYVNFCMKEPCRTLSQIYEGELKTYGEVVDDTGKLSPSNPIPVPIPDKVGISFCERVEKKPISKGGYSQHKKDYKTLIENVLKSQC